MSDLMPVVSQTTVIDRGMLPVADVVARVRRIQEVMQAVMKDGTHYGTIPGTPKPTLYQPGAELLCVTFRIATSPRVEDLCSDDTIRYRVTMQATSQVTGEALGEGVGECSSDEEKYRWRRPVCDEEWAETPESHRREKWAKGKNGTYKAKQVRMSPADVANTILKMAAKRALIAMTRTVLACSDQFAQDLEDLPEEVRESVVSEGGSPSARPPIQPPQRKSAPPAAPPANGQALHVKGVEKKSGETNGKKWTIYIVTFSDGRHASTFDEAMATQAAKYASEQTAVEIVTEPGRKEGSLNLVEIQRTEAEDAF